MSERRYTGTLLRWPQNISGRGAEPKAFGVIQFLGMRSVRVDRRELPGADIPPAGTQLTFEIRPGHDMQPCAVEVRRAGLIAALAAE